MLTLRTGQDRTRKIANLTWLSRKRVTGSFCNYCDVSMLVQCALQDKYLVAPSFRVYLSSREPSCCWWGGRSFGWLVTNRRAREGNLRGDISCLFTHRRTSLILFLSYELEKRPRSVHWPTHSAALPPAVSSPDKIVPASRCWRAERQWLPVIFMFFISAEYFLKAFI